MSKIPKYDWWLQNKNLLLPITCCKIIKTNQNWHSERLPGLFMPLVTACHGVAHDEAVEKPFVHVGVESAVLWPMWCISFPIMGRYKIRY